MELAWEADVLPLNYARARISIAKRSGRQQGGLLAGMIPAIGRLPEGPCHAAG